MWAGPLLLPLLGLLLRLVTPAPAVAAGGDGPADGTAGATVVVWVAAGAPALLERGTGCLWLAGEGFSELDVGCGALYLLEWNCLWSLQSSIPKCTGSSLERCFEWNDRPNESIGFVGEARQAGGAANNKSNPFDNSYTHRQGNRMPCFACNDWTLDASIDFGFGSNNIGCILDRSRSHRRRRRPTVNGSSTDQRPHGRTSQPATRYIAYPSRSIHHHPLHRQTDREAKRRTRGRRMAAPGSDLRTPAAVTSALIVKVCLSCLKYLERVVSEAHTMRLIGRCLDRSRREHPDPDPDPDPPNDHPPTGGAGRRAGVPRRGHDYRDALLGGPPRAADGARRAGGRPHRGAVPQGGRGGWAGGMAGIVGLWVG